MSEYSAPTKREIPALLVNASAMKIQFPKLVLGSLFGTTSKLSNGFQALLTLAKLVSLPELSIATPQMLLSSLSVVPVSRPHSR